MSGERGPTTFGRCLGYALVLGGLLAAMGVAGWIEGWQ